MVFDEVLKILTTKKLVKSNLIRLIVSYFYASALAVFSLRKPA